MSDFATAALLIRIESASKAFLVNARMAYSAHRGRTIEVAQGRNSKLLCYFLIIWTLWFVISISEAVLMRSPVKNIQAFDIAHVYHPLSGLYWRNNKQRLWKLKSIYFFFYTGAR